jgi:hypothetical protein
MRFGSVLLPRSSEIEFVASDGMCGLGQPSKVCAYTREVRVGGKKFGQTLCHTQNVEGTREDSEPHAWITTLQALKRLHRDKHVFGHLSLRQFTAAAGNGNVLAQLRNRAVALGRQTANNSGGS